MTSANELRARLDALSPDRRELVEKMLLARRAAGGGIPQRDRSRPAPLAPPQRRLWFMDQLAPGSPVYNAIVAVRVDGPLDLAVVRRVMERIVARHEVLRTVFRSVDEMTADVSQVVLDDWQLSFEIVSACGADAHERLVDGVRLLQEFGRRPYDLAVDLPLRIIAVAVGDDCHLLGFGEHHIAFDGWSDEIMFTELAAGYAAEIAGTGWAPEPMVVQYADVAAWLQDRAPDARRESYWQRQLAGAPHAVELPVDRPHPDTPRYRGVHVPMRIDGALPDLDSLRVAERCTSFMVLSATLAGAVYRWSGCREFVLGTPFANRNHSVIEPLIGFFSNTLPLRFTVDGGESFRALARQSRALCIEAFQHQDVAFERIVELSRQPRDRRRNPVFQVNIRVQQGGPAVPDLVGLTTSAVDVDLGFARFDLAVDLSVTRTGITGYCEYNSDLFDPATIDRFIDWSQQFIADCLARPDIPLRDLRFGPQPVGVRAGRRRAGGGAP
ncbi:condensation domain-containing protein [uncultured Jatrophihabitans sp.]|uniref:condensation domain-containing protein n=1 Tax=uncultured Jatrophihabitans sp. TaxID=1610747 RepID=UPI0035CB4F23